MQQTGQIHGQIKTSHFELGIWGRRSLCVSNHTDTSHEYLITMAGYARAVARGRLRSGLVTLAGFRFGSKRWT